MVMYENVIIIPSFELSHQRSFFAVDCGSYISELAKVWRISYWGLSGPKWGIYIKPFFYSSGNVVEEGVGRTEEQHVGEQ